MASKKTSKKELGNLILELLDFMITVGIQGQLLDKLKTDEIQGKLARTYQIYANLSEIKDALTYLNSENKIELDSFYIIESLSGPIISCFVRKNREKAKPKDRYSNCV